MANKTPGRKIKADVSREMFIEWLLNYKSDLQTEHIFLVIRLRIDIADYLYKHFLERRLANSPVQDPNLGFPRLDIYKQFLKKSRNRWKFIRCTRSKCI